METVQDSFLSSLGSEKEGSKLLKLIVINLYRLLLNDPGEELGEWRGCQGSQVGPVIWAGGHHPGRVE